MNQSSSLTTVIFIAACALPGSPVAGCTDTRGVRPDAGSNLDAGSSHDAGLNLDSGSNPDARPDQGVDAPSENAGSFDAADDGSASADGDVVEDSGLDDGDSSTARSPLDASAPTDGSNDGPTESGADAGPSDDGASLQDSGSADSEGPEASDGATVSTTEQLLARRGPPCLKCAQVAGCVGPGAPTCGTPPTSGIDWCAQTLQCVLASGCTAGSPIGDVTACLCGTFDAGACSAGTTPPNGPCASDYIGAFGTSDVTRFWGSLDDSRTAGGKADLVVACLALASCTTCF